MKPDLLMFVNENTADAERALKTATSESIVESCREYLKKLAECRTRLYELQGAQELNLKHSSPLAKELILQARKAVLTALQHNVSQINQTESFIVISGYEAADIFNQLKYKGSANWEMRPGGLRAADQPESDPVPIVEAVETAGRLRREAYVAKQSA
jgi:hypothetical protein